MRLGKRMFPFVLPAEDFKLADSRELPSAGVVTERYDPVNPNDRCAGL